MVVVLCDRGNHLPLNAFYLCLILSPYHQISRNRLGVNDHAHEIAKEEAAKAKARKERDAANATKKKNATS